MSCALYRNRGGANWRGEEDERQSWMARRAWDGDGERLGLFIGEERRWRGRGTVAGGRRVCQWPLMALDVVERWRERRGGTGLRDSSGRGAWSAW